MREVRVPEVGDTVEARIDLLGGKIQAGDECRVTKVRLGDFISSLAAIEVYGYRGEFSFPNHFVWPKP